MENLKERFVAELDKRRILSIAIGSGVSSPMQIEARLSAFRLANFWLSREIMK